MQERRKQRKGRYKDKQGFTWRPFIAADEELPMPRVPHPHIEFASLPCVADTQPVSLSAEEETSKVPKPKPEPKTSAALTPPSSPPIKPNSKPVNGDIVRAPPRTLPRQKALPSTPNLQRPSHFSPGTTRTPTARLKKSQGISQDSETGSVLSTHSENSFQTASSDVQLNYIPKQIKDNYKTVPQGSTALERKSSVRAIQQQQYNVLPAGQEGSGKPAQQTGTNKTQSNKTSR